jgi:ADP-heptose:LPS heptosyltransferase
MDKWLGVPLCFALTIVRAVLGQSAPDSSKPPRNILFVKLAEQGSTVLAYPALRRAVEMVGRENVYFIALTENRFILDILGVIPEKNVLTISNKTVFEFVGSALAAIRRLHDLNLEATIDMEFFARGSAALTFLSGATRRVGFHGYFGAGLYRGNLMTHRMLYKPHLHTSQIFLTLVEAVLSNPKTLPAFNFVPAATGGELPQFAPRAAEVEEVRRKLLDEIGMCPPLILLNPNASDLLPLRRWPLDYYVELARRILERHPEVFIVLTGGPEEESKVMVLARQIGSKRCLSLAGKTTLRQLLVLYTLAKVLVTNDSGPAHFATLTPVRVITLFGPETPALFGSQTPRNVALWAGLACSPCVNAYNNRQSPCKKSLCMESITVDHVFDQVCRAYEYNGNGGAKI